MAKLCSVDDCTKEIEARGLCHKHSVTFLICKKPYFCKAFSIDIENSTPFCSSSCYDWSHDSKCIWGKCLHPN